MAKSFFNFREGVAQSSKREEGTGSLVKTYKKDTPGESVEEVRNMGKDDKSRAKNQANYLANKKLMSKHKFANKKPTKEEQEVDELNKSTMARYTRAAARDINHQGIKGDTNKIKKRVSGIDKATNKLAMRKEETEITEFKVHVSLVDPNPHTDDKKCFDAAVKKFKAKKVGNSEDGAVYDLPSLRHASNFRDAVNRGCPKKTIMVDSYQPKDDVISEAKSKAGDVLMTYAKKSGGIDKKDMMTIAGKLQNYAATGNPSNKMDIAKTLKGMDTDPRDKVIDILMKNDPAMGRAIMQKAGLKLREDKQMKSFFNLRENANKDYKASSEKSQFGGYRAKLINPQGKVSYLSATAWKTAKAAEGEAAAYRDGYFGGPGRASERGADRMVRAYKQKNAKDLYKKESVEESKQLDELSPKTLRNYRSKAAADQAGGNPMTRDPKRFDKRSKGIARANKKLAGDNPFELYTSKPGWEKASKELEAAVKSKNKAKVQQLQKKYAALGARDTEANQAIRQMMGESVEVNEAIRDRKSYEAGQKAAQLGKKYDTNPNPKGSQAHLDWSKGHNSARSAKIDRRNEEVELDEARFSDKQIKMAYGILNDPRWKGGNMTAIVRKIEGIAKGLSSHPGVRAAIRRTNEEFESLVNTYMAEANDNDQESSMAEKQLEFIEYAAEEIDEWLEDNDMPEWFQNKLTQAFTLMQGLHSYMEGETGDDGEKGEDDKEK